MCTDNDEVVDVQDIKEDAKDVKRNAASRERLKIISKYINIFEIIYIARFIDYKLICQLAFVSQKTVERAFKEIRSNPYAKKLIIEVKEGNSIVVYASNTLLRLMGSKHVCPLSLKATDREVYMSQKRKDEGLMRALKHVYADNNINKEISKALTDANFTEIEDRSIKKELKQSREFLSKSYSYQNYIVYEYTYNLLEFNNQINFGDINFDSASGVIVADVFCFSHETDDIIRTYDKALLLLESLKHINYKDCKDCKVKINYIVLTLDRADIKGYLSKMNNTFRYHTLDFFDNYFYVLNLSDVSIYKHFFKIYRYTVMHETKFILFSNLTGKAIEYGVNPKKKQD